MIREAHVRSTGEGLRHTVEVGPHSLAADAPKDAGGDDTAPDPEEYLLVALGSCTAITLSMYARHKKWPLEAIDVRVRGNKEPDAFVIERTITVRGGLDDEQRTRLKQIAEKCPVHKILTGEVRIATSLS